MDLKQHYTVDEVIEIVNSLPIKDREIVNIEIQKSLFDSKSILEIITPFHIKYEQTYKNLA